MPKLYEVPAGRKKRVVDTDETIYKFYNLDGMYSYCVNEKNETVHIVAWAEVEVIE
jgi:hypothetical protein